MATAAATFDAQFLEMRARLLSLAADFDRLERAAGGADLLANDARVRLLREAARIAFGADTDRAARVQLVFSDPV